MLLGLYSYRLLWLELASDVASVKEMRQAYKCVCVLMCARARVCACVLASVHVSMCDRARECALVYEYVCMYALKRGSSRGSILSSVLRSVHRFFFIFISFALN